MTREERQSKLNALIACLKCEVSGKSCDTNCPTQYDAGNMGEIIENLETISKILEQESNYKSFCEFVAKTIMEEDFELNAGANAEIFCRKLVKLGIIKANGDEWELCEKLEQEPCEDCISRKAVLDLTETYLYHPIINPRDVMDLPSVIPQETKRGHWKVVGDGYGDNAYICECSECKDTLWVYKCADRKWNYCPNCGAKMTEPQESKE